MNKFFEFPRNYTQSVGDFLQFPTCNLQILSFYSRVGFLLSWGTAIPRLLYADEPGAVFICNVCESMIQSESEMMKNWCAKTLWPASCVLIISKPATSLRKGNARYAK